MANEKRLIDANVLIETGEEGYITDIFPNWNGFPQSVQNAVCEYGRYIKNLIQEQPTVDAVEVVRCKDCIHYCQTHGYSHTYMGCMIFDGANEIPYETEPDDFCSHGERRSEDA